MKQKHFFQSVCGVDGGVVVVGGGGGVVGGGVDGGVVGGGGAEAFLSSNCDDPSVPACSSVNSMTESHPRSNVEVRPSHHHHCTAAPKWPKYQSAFNNILRRQYLHQTLCYHVVKVSKFPSLPVELMFSAVLCVGVMMHCKQIGTRLHTRLGRRNRSAVH